MMKDVVFDSDDFAFQTDRNCLRELEFLKDKFPNFKITLFSVPRYRNSIQDDFFKWVNEEYNWIQLAIHGWRHDTNFEFSQTEYNQAKIHLEACVSKSWFVKGFKAPGWQISRDTYKACLDQGVWVADHMISVYTEPEVMNKDRRPKELRVYEIGHPWSVHTHTWNCEGNGISEMIGKWEKDGYPFDKFSNFYFIDEVIKNDL